jgi:hypothetical protein
MKHNPLKKFKKYSVLLNIWSNAGGVHEQLRNIYLTEAPPTNKTTIYLLYT